MATKLKHPRQVPAPVKAPTRPQLSKSLAALAGLASPLKQKLPKGK